MLTVDGVDGKLVEGLSVQRRRSRSDRLVHPTRPAVVASQRADALIAELDAKHAAEVDARLPFPRSHVHPVGSGGIDRNRPTRLAVDVQRRRIEIESVVEDRTRPAVVGSPDAAVRRRQVDAHPARGDRDVDRASAHSRVAGRLAASDDGRADRNPARRRRRGRRHRWKTFLSRARGDATSMRDHTLAPPSERLRVVIRVGWLQPPIWLPGGRSAGALLPGSGQCAQLSKGLNASSRPDIASLRTEPL